MPFFHAKQQSNLPSPTPASSSSSSSSLTGGGGAVLTPNRKSGIPNPNGGAAPNGRASRMSKLGFYPSPVKPAKTNDAPITTLEAARRAPNNGGRSSCLTPERSFGHSTKRNCAAGVVDGGIAAKRSLDGSSPCVLSEKKKKGINDAMTGHDGRTPDRGPPPRELSSLSSSADEEEGVRVCVRIRPLSFENDVDDVRPRAYVLAAEENTIVRNSGDEGSAVEEDARYVFDRVYGESSTTLQLYDEVIADIVESVGRQGRNGTVFTYGQTSTGKTHTMHGILMAAGRDLFGMTMDDGRDKAPVASFRSLTSVRISCMELYNEELRDLLCRATDATSSLPIQEDGRGSVQIPGLTERTVLDINELMDVVRIAEGNRTVGSTAMNERSSRSHTIYRIMYERREALTAGVRSFDELAQGCASKEDKENDSTRDGGKSSRTSSQKVLTTVSTLNLVDLAGSESVRVTGATGERQKEGGKINKSLLTLSRVLSKLGKKDGGHVNYRDSKLTRILKPSLSGNARMGCICCISPDVKYVEESKSTLDFATRTMLVTTNAKSNIQVEYKDGLVEEFEREIERIKMESAKSEESRLRMEKALLENADEIVCLKANIELSTGRAASMERENKRIMMQLEELNLNSEKDRDGLLKEICDLKARNHELEKTLIECASEKKMMMKHQEVDRGSFAQELKQMKVEQTLMAEKANIKFQEELKAVRDEVHALMLSNTDSTTEQSNRFAELERTNEDLRGQLASANESNNSAQDKVASLISAIEALTREKLQLELKLTREIQKSTKRRDEAKERRQKFKGKLAGMAETLKDATIKNEDRFVFDVALVRKMKFMALDRRRKKDEWPEEEELLKWWHIMSSSVK